MNHVIGLIIALIIAFPIGLWWAFAFATLWGWFVVPFFGVHLLSVPQAYGVVLVMLALRPQVRLKQSKYETNDPYGWTMLFIGPAIYIGIGWVVKELML